MYFFTTFALFSAIALSSAIPTYSSDIRLFPRQQMLIENCTDGSPVDGAGEKLNLEATAEAHPIDKTAVVAARAVSIRTSDGNCLTIDACGGDFRQNLIPVQTKACRDSKDRNIASQQFDLITKAKHIQQEGGMLVVSSLVRWLIQRCPLGKLKADDRDADARLPKSRWVAQRRCSKHLLLRWASWWRHVLLLQPQHDGQANQIIS